MLFMIAVSAAVSNTIPLFYKYFIETAQSKNYDNLILLLFGITVLILSESILSGITQSCAVRITLKVEKEAITDLLVNLQNLDYKYHTEKSAGKLISIMNRFSRGFEGLFESLNRRVLGAALNFIIALCLIGTISWKISIAILLVFLASTPIFAIFIKATLATRKATYEPDEKLTAVIIDNLTNFETVKAFAKENIERNRLKIAFDNVTRAFLNHDNLWRFFDLSTTSVSALLVFVGVFISIDLIKTENISIPNFIVLIGILLQLSPKLFDLVYYFRDVFKNYIDFYSFAEILVLKPTILDPIKPVILNDVNGNIDFKNVSFGYHTRRAISNVNLHIEAGQKIAFVGPSGAGKTTVTKLLMRYYDTKSGNILIDNVNIKDITQNNLREIIGIVPQDPAMFNNTIFFNVGYALENPKIEDVEEACKLAQLHNFIMTLPDKYDTVVGERGIKLSGGQKQRLAIARMILKNPRILIFDEATSALDSESEQLIQKAFAEVSKGKTTIVIAHRLSTIVNSDNIFVIDDGKLMQSGKHNDLIMVEGIYKKLWDIQSGGFISSF
ncbi:MAG: ABC transporter ATP-binding protein [bacterium]